MKTINYIQMIVLLLSIGTTTVLGQSKIVRKETDKRDCVSFAKFATDTVVPLKNAPDLLKKLQPQAKDVDDWKHSTRRKEIKDENGYVHQFYQQYHKGIKVESGEFSIHAINDNIESVLGNFESVGDVSVTARLSEKEALNSALKHIGADVYKWQIPEEEAWIKEYYNGTYYPKGELVIVRDQLKTDSEYRLAYKFDIYAHKPMSSNYVWVDAITGEVINIESRILFSNATGTAATRYSGTRTITTDLYNGTYRLRETRNGVQINTYNMQWGTNFNTASDFIDNDNNWTAIEYNNTNRDNAALDAHWGAEMVYEYFKQVHNRNSWNGSGGAIMSYVNADMASMGYGANNAFWSSQDHRIAYGYGTFSPLTTLDICAHELGHAVCQTTANLVYQKESGAINESLSDIWAACVENWATTDKQTWVIGEDLEEPLRIMSNPKLLSQPNTYQSPLLTGGFWVEQNGCTPNQNNDYCGVHRNSGVGNFWFFLLSQGGTGTNDLGNTYNVTGIGINKAAAIVYKAETSYLTSSANYAQFRTATISAAIDTFGNNSTEVIAVTNAWYAVGVGNPYIEIAGPSYVDFEQYATYTIPNLPSGTYVSWIGSNNVYFTGGQTGQSVTIFVSGGNSATLTAILSGSVYQTLSKNITVYSGAFNVTYYGEYATVTLGHPSLATCFDWEISGFTGEIGTGTINCSGYSSLTLTPLSNNNNNNGYVTARYHMNDYGYSYASNWYDAVIPIWRPVIDVFNSDLNPELCQNGSTTCRINLVQPYPYENYPTYVWYINNSTLDATTQPYIDLYISGCMSGTHNISVKVMPNGYVVCPKSQSVSFSASCTYGCSNTTYSAAYPNPAGNELIIDKIEEENSAETAAISAQSARGKTSEIRVLLYSNSTAQLVYNKTYSSSEKQIKIDTSKLPNGIYHLNIIENGEKIKEQTIVVSH
jgi:Zn-dependent metalloprotease